MLEKDILVISGTITRIKASAVTFLQKNTIVLKGKQKEHQDTKRKS